MKKIILILFTIFFMKFLLSSIQIPIVLGPMGIAIVLLVFVFKGLFLSGKSERKRIRESLKWYE